MRKQMLKTSRRPARNRNARLRSVIETMESRVLYSAAVYSGVATNAANPTAATVNSGFNFLSVFGGATVGAVNGSIAQAYGVLEFGPSSTAFAPAGHHVNSLSSISLTLFNSASTGNFGGASGTLNIYLAPDTTTPLTTGTNGTLRYQTSDLPTGVGGTTPQLGIVETGANSTLLGTFAFDHTIVNTAELSQLTNYSAAVANTIVNDLNTGTTFRLVIAAGDSTVAADLNGSTTITTATKYQYDPVVSFGVDETITAQALSFSAPTYSVNESAGTETITVNRAPAANGDLTGTETVNYATSDGTTTVTPTAISETGNTVTVTAGNSFAVGQQVTISGVTPAGYNGTYAIVSATSTNFTYTDSTAGLTAVTAGNFGTASVTSAAAGTNYTAASGTLTFAPGVTSQTITVPISNLHPQGGNKFFNLTLSNPVLTGDAGINAVVANPATVPVTILDNQETFTLSSPTYTVNESAGTAEFSVTRTGFLADPATVSYKTTDGTAVSGTNYTGTQTGTVTFAAGNAVGVFSIPILAASPQGGNLNFTVTLTSATQTGAQAGDFGLLGSQTTATETIVDSAPLTNNLTGTAASVLAIETSGPFSQSYAPVVGDVKAGTGSFSFLAYEVLEFSPAAAPGLYPTTGTTVNTNGIANLSLQLFNTDATGTDNYSGHVGNFNVYFIPDSDATTASSALKFSTSAAALPSGLTPGVKPASGAVFTVAPVLLGTFSFDNIAGYDTYTPATVPASVESALVTDLNSGANFRLAVTPGTNGTGAIAADFRGFASGQTPILSFSAAQTVNKTPEYIAFNVATYSVSETAGNATITLSRTGPTTDSATVAYATTDGTALAGTNYTTTTGTATFAVGSATATFTVPVTNVTNQGGNKALTLTLSSPATGSTGTIGVLGSQSTATLTILDSSTAPTETLTPPLSYVADVEAKGPYDDTEFKVEGTASINPYASYGAADFNDGSAGGGGVVTPANTVTAINSITLNVTNNASNAAGPINVYLVPDSASNILVGSPQSPNPHFFDATQGVEGLGTQFGTPVLLGKVNYTDTTGGHTLAIPLINYSASAEATLIAALNNKTKFRIVATPENASVDADWVATATSISLNVQEGAAAAPTLVNSIVGDGSAQRSTFDSSSVVFNEKVNFTASSFTLSYETVADNQAVQNSGGSLTPTFTTLSNANDLVFSSPDGGITWTVSPKVGGAVDRTAGAGDSNGLGVFIDGLYSLNLHGAAITDLATSALHFNNSLDQVVQFADGTGTLHHQFSALFGDIAGTANVTANDNKAFSKAFLTSSGDVGYNAAFDYTGTNSSINANDNKKFSKNFLVTLLLS